MKSTHYVKLLVKDVALLKVSCISSIDVDICIWDIYAPSPLIWICADSSSLHLQRSWQNIHQPQQHPLSGVCFYLETIQNCSSLGAIVLRKSDNLSLEQKVYSTISQHTNCVYVRFIWSSFTYQRLHYVHFSTPPECLDLFDSIRMMDSRNRNSMSNKVYKQAKYDWKRELFV